jgi:alkylhydroperoxidase/carboxymuconolactone decarboxylase family protein YurZ
MGKLPAAYERFQRTYRRVWEAYDRLGATAHREGPLDHKTRELVKLGMAIGGRLEGAVRSHAGRALEAGAARGEIEHVVALAVTTVGFPTAVAAFTWVEDVLKRGRRLKRRKPPERRIKTRRRAGRRSARRGVPAG